MEFRGIIGSIIRKIFLLISRGKVLAIDNDYEEMQKIQISNLADEVISDIERYQEYGFENFPVIPNAEAITLFIYGNRNANKGINIKINNRKLRPTDLASGDVCIYTIDSNNTNANRIWMKPEKNEINIVTYDGHNILINDDGIIIEDGVNAHKVTFDNNGILVEDGVNSHKVTLDGTGIIVEDSVNSGNIITLDSAGLTIEDMNGNTIEMGVTSVKINGNLEVLQ
jgi:phage gp45-like